MPTPIETFDAAGFRRRLAGMVESRPDESDPAELRERGVRLCLVLAELFGESLDRLTLWQRIATAIRSASQKAPDGGVELVNEALDHVKANEAAAASSESLASLLGELESRGGAWNRRWASHLHRAIYSVVVFGRQAWNERKEEKKKTASRRTRCLAAADGAGSD